MRIRGNGLGVFLLLVSGLCSSANLTAGERSIAGSPPPDEPAEVTLSGREITVEYEKTVLFRGEIRTELASTQTRVNSDRSSDRINQTILLTSARGGTRIRISGMIYGSTESFPCESDRREQGLSLVRHSSGLSKSYLNRAVYDRQRDWLFSVDANPSVVVKPLAQSGTGRSFSLEAEGGEIVLRFRPLYYRKHRGLSFFEPWNYRVWPGSVAGWISWFAFYDKITEDDIVRTAQVVAEVLRPFGYEYIQIDDGYERDQGLPEYWLQPNEKFPHGLGYLSEFIKSKGLKPAVWTNVSFRQRDFAEAHKNWFVLDPFGNVARGNWIELSLDASQPEALNSVVRPIYRGLKKLGWEYFKVDALRHLRYEGYNANGDYFKRKGSGLVETYRRYVQAIREEIGRDSFLNACWGIRPELTGIVDGCRLGTDGFSYAGLSQYNSFNNVVWRNDPDHIRLDDDAYSSTMVTSLTGSTLLLTDKPEVYRTGAVEPAKRTAPVLFYFARTGL